MSGSPAAATSVVAQSSAETMSLISVRGGTTPDQINPFWLVNKEVRVQPSAFYDVRDFETTLDLFDSGVLAPHQMITDEVGLDSMPAAFEALKQQADTAWIPVIFLTTAVDVKKLSALLARGALGVIQKPFSPMRLPFEIRQLWNRREGPRRPAGFLPEIPS